MKTTENITLPNGLPLYKLMLYKPTKEKCQIVKVNKVKLDELGRVLVPLSVDIILFRKLHNISYNVLMYNISQYDLIVWTENMNPSRDVLYKHKRKQTRIVHYIQAI